MKNSPEDSKISIMKKQKPQFSGGSKQVSDEK